MIDNHRLEQLIASPRETEVLEFKEAKESFNKKQAAKYCVALANEGGGYLILGVTDESPRQVSGSNAFRGEALQDLRNYLRERLSFSVTIQEIQFRNRRTLIFEIPGRPAGTPWELEGAYLMRAGESLVPMTPDRLRDIFGETAEDWLLSPATETLAKPNVIELLDVQKYFELLSIPLPTDQEGIMDRFRKDGLVTAAGSGWQVSNLGMVLLARDLSKFGPRFGRKAVRVVIYEGANKARTRAERTFRGGIASDFEEIIEFVSAAAPKNALVEEALREEVQMFPKQAIRELVANALIHQDFSVTGAGVMIELYENRVEVSNPGIPPIEIDRFIDEYRSRNESLASLARALGLCEEKGSGIDKVVVYAEIFQLPAPNFIAGDLRTTAVLFGHQDFEEMSRADRIRACYQHAAISYLTRSPMSNSSLRKRFGLSKTQAAIASQIIGLAREAKQIKIEPSETNSTRYARYLPYWA